MTDAHYQTVKRARRSQRGQGDLDLLLSLDLENRALAEVFTVLFPHIS